MRATKVVCTLGPASIGKVLELVAAGMDVARVNFSHGTSQQHERMFAGVRSAEAQTGKPLAILADLSGPKVRIGSVSPDPLDLRPGRSFELRCDGADGDASGASTTHRNLAVDLEPGDRVLIADGAVELRVVSTEAGTVHTEVVRGGRVRSHAGVNAPSDRLTLPAVTDKDRADLHRALELGADFIAQSFVRSAADVRQLRRVAGEREAYVIAKVETRPAVEAFDALSDEADAIMLARGDLGVEMAFEKLPVLQKDLVRGATRSGTPIIVATQMLESMTGSPRPTRAEATDVANAVLDGADAIMLSAETAIGRYPVEAADAASRIASEAEIQGKAYLPEGQRELPGSEPQSIARAAAALAESDPRVAAIACFTRTGRTAALLSAVRPRVPVHAFSPDPSVTRRLQLYRGVHPAPMETRPNTEAMVESMDARLRELGRARPGMLVVMLASTPVGVAQTNLLKLHRIGP